MAVSLLPLGEIILAFHKKPLLTTVEPLRPDSTPHSTSELLVELPSVIPTSTPTVRPHASIMSVPFRPSQLSFQPVVPIPSAQHTSVHPILIGNEQRLLSASSTGLNNEEPTNQDFIGTLRCSL